MSETPKPCDTTPSCVRELGHLGRCANASGEEMATGFAGRTPEGCEELGGLGIAGISERYRLVDGRLEVWFPSDRTWIRQKRSEWDTRERWEKEAGFARVMLAKSRAVLSLFDSPPVAAPPVGPAPSASHAHCWHSYGPSSGSMSSDGSFTTRGQNRCCHCGEVQRYDYSTGPQAPVIHGRFYREILSHG